MTATLDGEVAELRWANAELQRRLVSGDSFYRTAGLLAAAFGGSTGGGMVRGIGYAPLGRSLRRFARRHVRASGQNRVERRRDHRTNATNRGNSPLSPMADSRPDSVRFYLRALSNR